MLDIPTTFIVAPPWGGKTQILEILRHMTEYDPQYWISDMSAIITWHCERKTAHGKKFTEQQETRDNGELFGARLIIDALIDAIRTLVRPASRHLFIAGVPRNLKQVDLVIRNFGNPRLVHIEADWSEIERAMKNTVRESRVDDNPETVPGRFRLYDEMTSPGVAHWVAAGLPHLLLKRSDSMASKIRQIIKRTDEDKSIRRLWKQRCSNDKHHAGYLISELDAKTELQRLHEAQRLRYEQSASMSESDSSSPAFAT